MGIDPVTASLIAGGTSLLAAKSDADSRSDATDAAMQQRKASQDFIQKQIDQARADIFKLYPSAQESQQKGLQAGLSLYQQALPQMLNTFQQGNMGAQNALLAGLPQMNNAILGNKVDYSGLQPVQLQQPQAPNVPQMDLAPISGLQLGQQPQQPQIDPAMLAQLQAMYGGQNA